MKCKKTIGLLIFIILNLSFLLQDYNIVNRVQEENAKEDFGSISSSGDSFVYEWGLTWGWTGSHEDIANGIALDSSGNIYIAGYTRKSFEDYNMCLVKFNSTGHYQWNRTWGGIDDEFAQAITLDSSDNIYLAGSSDNTTGGDRDMCLVKFNSSGDYKSNITWGWPGFNDYAGTMALDSSGNIYLGGSTYNSGTGYSDICLVKFNNLGEYQWNSTWGSSVDDWCEAMALDSSGNIYLGGSTYNSIGNMILVKFNSFGEFQWNRTWNSGGEDEIGGIAFDSSENIYLAGSTEKPGESSDIVVIHYDNSGMYQWNRTLGGPSDREYARAITLDSSDNIYLAGGKDVGSTGYPDCFLMICDSLGSPQWNHTWSGGSTNIYFAITLDSSENIYLAGGINFGSWSQMCLVKINAHPKILINAPNENEFYGTVAPNYNISILESELNTIWYTLDGGATNITFSGFTGTINQTQWDKKGNEMVTIRFYANDTLRNEGYTEATVRKDTIPPTSSISYIVHKEPNMVNKSTSFTLTADDGQGSGVASIMYKINDGDWTNYSTPFDLSDYKIGNHNISYYSIDKVGNIESINSQEVKIPGPGAIPGYNLLLLISLICVISVVSFKYRNKSLKK